MSEEQSPGDASPSARAAIDKKVVVEQSVADLLRLMGLPARLELKDAAEGGLSVAVFFDQEQAAAPVGKRSHLIDALQLLVNKMVNRPQAERRWVAIGVGGHPEPRPLPGAPRAPRPSGPPPPRAASPAPASARPSGPARPVASAARPPPPARPPPVDEGTLAVSEDLALSRAGRTLAARSAKLGRFSAVAPMNLDDRARLFQATRGVPGTTVRVEGEGTARRLLFSPDRPTPMPKKAVPDYGEDEDA